MEAETLELIRSQTAAGWFQAIGSVAAILVSVGVVACQHSLDRRRDRDLAATRLNAARASVRSLSEAVIGASNGAKAAIGQIQTKDAAGWRSMMQFARRGLEPLRNASAAAAVAELASAPVWSSWTLFVGCLNATIEIIQDQITWADTRSGNPVVDQQREQDVIKRLQDMVDHAQELITVLAEDSEAR